MHQTLSARAGTFGAEYVR